MARSRSNPVLRARIETGIGLAAPLLDLLLAAGDRISRIIGREEADHTPVRIERPGDYARRGISLRDRSHNPSDRPGRSR
jgi:hypothetical protein